MLLRRRTFLTGALAAGTLRAAPGAPNKVRVSVNSQLTMAPFYQAYESGYFSESGLSIELQKDMGSAQSIPLLAGSRLDVAFEGLNPGLYNAALRGARVRIVAGRETISRSCRTMGVVYVTAKVFPNGVRSMRELQGKRVAISAGNVGGQFVLDVLLTHEGMRLEDVDLRKMSTEERLIAIRSGGIDAFVASAGDMTPMLRSLQIVPGPMLADILPGFQYSYIAFGWRLGRRRTVSAGLPQRRQRLSKRKDAVLCERVREIQESRRYPSPGGVPRQLCPRWSNPRAGHREVRALVERARISARAR
jgi:hypothetical protein